MVYQKSAFTLIEILVGILIVTIVILSGFQVLSSAGIAKIKLVEQTRIEEEAYFASEKFFEMIKKGWTIDYEEYWNRSSYNETLQNGYYKNPTGYGNNGAIYYCASKNNTTMWTGGCLANFWVTQTWVSVANQTGKRQKYWEYALQFIDYNSDADGDGGDEDGDGNHIGDDDDLYLWIGPKAFSGSQVQELYLINAQGNERTYFRWNIQSDSYAPAGSTCNTTTGVWEKCLWTIEFLKLSGEDSDSDGRIDSWYIHPDFLPNTTSVQATAGNMKDGNIWKYWQPIFSDTINIQDVEFHLYPNKDAEYSWRDSDESLKVAPYLQLKMTLTPSWKEKRKISWSVPQIPITTTLSLLDLDID